MQPRGSDVATSFKTLNLSNGWKLAYSDHAEMFPACALQESRSLLRKWVDVFPTSNTWVRKAFGVPSLFVRVEGIFRDGKFHVIEIEDRPCGMGIAKYLNPRMADRIRDVRQGWPDFSWVANPEKVSDDGFWLGMPLTINEANASNALLLTRSRPDQMQYHSLEPRSVSTLKEEGNKEYGVHLGLWSQVKWVVDPTEPDGGYIEGMNGHSLVFKPLAGTRTHGVRVFLSQEDRRRFGGRGVSTLGAIHKEMSRRGTMYAQRFIEPMRFDPVPSFNGIYRFFFGFDPREGYVPLGGYWNAREDIIVHGTDDSVWGPLNF